MSVSGPAEESEVESRVTFDPRDLVYRTGAEPIAHFVLPIGIRVCSP